MQTQYNQKYHEKQFRKFKLLTAVQKKYRLHFCKVHKIYGTLTGSIAVQVSLSKFFRGVKLFHLRKFATKIFRSCTSPLLACPRNTKFSPSDLACFLTSLMWSKYFMILHKEIAELTNLRPMVAADHFVRHHERMKIP